eukprot:gene23436-biopygen4330
MFGVCCRKIRAANLKRRKPDCRLEESANPLFFPPETRGAFGRKARGSISTTRLLMQQNVCPGECRARMFHPDEELLVISLDYRSSCFDPKATAQSTRGGTKVGLLEAASRGLRVRLGSGGGGGKSFLFVADVGVLAVVSRALQGHLRACGANLCSSQRKSPPPPTHLREAPPDAHALINRVCSARAGRVWRRSSCVGEQDTGAGVARAVSHFWLGVARAWRGHVLFPLGRELADARRCLQQQEHSAEVAQMRASDRGGDAVHDGYSMRTLTPPWQAPSRGVPGRGGYLAGTAAWYGARRNQPAMVHGGMTAAGDLPAPVSLVGFPSGRRPRPLARRG